MPKILSGSWRLLAIALAVVMAVAVFVLPYHVPVSPTVSQSYQCGFNNHAALVLFLGAALLFALGTGGLPQASKAGDRRLPQWMLVAGVLVTLALCAVWRIDRAHKALGSESHYQLNRQVQLVSGLRLYRDLEFVYGPLLVYPGYWLQTGLRWSPVRSYMMAWTFEWIAGTVMLWCMIAWTDLPTRFRVALFVFLDLFTLIMLLPSEGTQYTQMRVFCASFLCVAVAAYWRRTQAPYRTAALMVAAIAGGFAVSPEQGVALGVGLSAYALLLAWKVPARFRWGGAALVLGGTFLIVAFASQEGALRSTHGFAQGGDSFPLLPSPMNVFVLCTYLCGLALLYRLLAEADWESAGIPMALCGLPMLSSAFGRCDLEHITSAVPLLLLGIFWLAGRRSTFAPWFVLACYFFFDFRGMLHLAGNAVRKVTHTSAVAVQAPALAGPSIPDGPDYFAPFAVPVALDGQPQWRAASGYYFGMDSVLTPEQITEKAEEIRQRHAPFLLLPDQTGEPAPMFWLAERDIHFVQLLERSPWAPKATRPLPSTRAITEAVESLYQPTAYRENGWRVWTLKS